MEAAEQIKGMSSLPDATISATNTILLRPELIVRGSSLKTNNLLTS